MEESMKDKLWREANELCVPRVLVTVTRLPSGALETMVNTELLTTKIQYIMDNYDEDLRLERNSEIQIVGFIVA